MLKFKRFLIFSVLIFLLISNGAFASSVSEHPQKVAVIVKELPELNSISCRFMQEKTMPNSNLLIKSGGNFRFIKNKGVFFETTYPIHSVTSYTSADYKQINEIVKAISNKSYSKIEKQFNFYFLKKLAICQIGLVPKRNAKTSKYINYIEINGSSDISKITILTKNLVKTTIYFMK